MLIVLATLVFALAVFLGFGVALYRGVRAERRRRLSPGRRVAQ
jgi:hypothetical protein